MRVQSVLKWVSPKTREILALVCVAVFAGLLSVLYSKFFEIFEKLAARLAELFTGSLFLFAPLCFIFSAYLVKRFSPAAAGSGIPQIMVAQDLETSNRQKISQLLSLRVLLIKIVSSLICILGGGVTGREGPTLHVAASLFYFISSRVSRWIAHLDSRVWIVAGASAGLASAFNTPLGGIVFAIEELSPAHFERLKLVSISAVIVSGMIAQALLGPYLYLNVPSLSVSGLNVWVGVLILALATGLIGAAFGQLLFLSCKKVRSFSTRAKYFTWPLVMGLLVATGFYFFGNNAIGPGRGLMLKLLNGQSLDHPVLLIFVRLLSNVATYSTGVAGGIFAPTLASGALIGAELSRLFSMVDPDLFILLGMCGLLSAVTHAPFTSFVLMLEMTDKRLATFPLMSCALLAYFISRWVQRESFYKRAKAFYEETA